MFFYYNKMIVEGFLTAVSWRRSPLCFVSTQKFDRKINVDSVREKNTKRIMPNFFFVIIIIKNALVVFLRNNWQCAPRGYRLLLVQRGQSSGHQTALQGQAHGRTVQLRAYGLKDY